MSKLDAQRAMREARYAQAAKSRPTPTATTRWTPQPVDSSAPAADAKPAGEACGHRSMNGRTCTREPGHAAKSHRYS